MLRGMSEAPPETTVEVHADVGITLRVSGDPQKPLVTAHVDGRHIVSFQVDTGVLAGPERLELVVRRVCEFELVHAALLGAVVAKLAASGA